MNAIAAGSFAVAGMLAEVPVIAVACALPEHGRMRVPQRWWFGAPARPVAVLPLSLLTGAAAGAVAARLPMSPALLVFWVFVILGAGLAIADVRRRRLPHPLTGFLWFACMLGLAAESAIEKNLHVFLRAMSAGLAVTVLTLAIALILPGQLGLGDVSLSGAIAMSLGWLSLDAVAVGLAVGLTIQAGIALVRLLLRNGARADQMPLGPALLMGWFVAIFLGTS